MNAGVSIPHPVEVMYGRSVSLSFGRDGQISAEKLHGLFAGDTRVLSTYRFAIGGFPWKLLGRSRAGRARGEWHFQNPAIREPAAEIRAGTLLLTLKRSLSGALHDDFLLCSYAERPLRVRFIIQIDSDFADIFQVKQQTLPPRLNVLRILHPEGVRLSYEHGGFLRGLGVSFHASGAPPRHIGTQTVFELDLKHGTEWKCCLEAAPVVGRTVIAFAGNPHEPEEVEITSDRNAPFIKSDSMIEIPFNRGRADLRSLAIVQSGFPSHLAAGVPWFFTLFGRDQLIAALMAGLDGGWSAEGALRSLAPWQSRADDDWRDAEPGKLPHELRQGELAHRNLIPHTPYYGTHDAPALYCMLLWQAWKWTGNINLVNSCIETAWKALEWCELRGDRDADGFQEYETRSSRGYYNQGWKDAGDAIVHVDGRQAKTPLATVELQGYLYAAYLAMAELLLGQSDSSQTKELTQKAAQLRTRVEHAFWMEDPGFYAMALDGDKQQVKSLSSNPGHLLWCGLPDRSRAKLLAQRFLKPDLFSGWGVRTLSTENPSYNPLSYQLGSVWPFDNALLAAGLGRYGLYEEAGIILRAVLEAAMRFEQERLPELFCGVDRSAGGPVPYEEANSPQAWSAAVPILAVQLFLGLCPDAPRNRCYLSPWLPEWLPRLEVNGIALADGTINVAIERLGSKTVIKHVQTKGIDVQEGMVEAPLWGEPISS